MEKMNKSHCQKILDSNHISRNKIKLFIYVYNNKVSSVESVYHFPHYLPYYYIHSGSELSFKLEYNNIISIINYYILLVVT